MARVCPACRRITDDTETVCRVCGGPTIAPETWQMVRQALPPPPPTPPEDVEKHERWVKFGLGGMLAALLFFVVYLIAYVFYYY